MKYKIVGILDILFSVIYSLTQLGLLIFVYPKMFNLYQDMDVKLPPVTEYYPIFSIISLALFLMVGYVGFLLLKKPNDKQFIVGIIALFAMLFIGGYLVGTSVLSLVNPLYSISSSL